MIVKYVYDEPDNRPIVKVELETFLNEPIVLEVTERGLDIQTMTEEILMILDWEELEVFTNLCYRILGQRPK